MKPQLRHSHLPVLISVITCSPIYRSSWAHAQLRSGTWQQVGEPVHDGWGHRQGSYVLVYLLQLGDYGAGDQLHHMMRKMESHSCPLSEETWKWKQSPHSNRYSSQNWNRGNVHSSLGNTLAGHGGNLICGAVIIVRKKKKKNPCWLSWQFFFLLQHNIWCCNDSNNDNNKKWPFYVL